MFSMGGYKIIVKFCTSVSRETYEYASFCDANRRVISFPNGRHYDWRAFPGFLLSQSLPLA